MTTATLAREPLVIDEEIFVGASLEKTFASLIAQMGRRNETPDGKPLPMILEPFPGGRWYRDLGGENGHLWGFVQSIKRPALLEIWGPLFMSNGATSNIQYRLTRAPDPFRTWQLFFPDPNGVEVEIDFDPSEPQPTDWKGNAPMTPRN